MRIFVVLALFLGKVWTAPSVKQYEVKPFTLSDDAKLEIRFDKHKILYSFIDSEKEQKIFKKYYDNSSCPVDFWKAPTVGDNVTYRVPAEYADKIEMDLKQNKIKFTVLTDDLQSWIDQEKAAFQAPLFSDKSFNVSEYQISSYLTYDQIQQYIERIAQENPSFVSLDEIGETYERRRIRGLKLSTGAGSPIWIDAGIHAREWISPATALSLIERIVADKKSGAGSILDKHDVYIYPLLNADGYAYTHAGNRMWRKNRIQYQGTNCIGVDPNRNFDFNFASGEGASGDVCAETYRGHVAFGTQEAQAVRDGVMKIRPVFFLTMHSYSQVIMLPYGSGSQQHSQFYNEQMKVACAGANAIRASTGLTYRAGDVRTVLRTSASGSSADWAHSKAGVKHSIALELRDTGAMGFMLPASQIQPSGQEIYAALKAMVAAIDNPSAGADCRSGSGSSGGFPGFPNWSGR